MAPPGNKKIPTLFEKLLHHMLSGRYHVILRKLDINVKAFAFIAG